GSAARHDEERRAQGAPEVGVSISTLLGRTVAGVVAVVVASVAFAAAVPEGSGKAGEVVYLPAASDLRVAVALAPDDSASGVPEPVPASRPAGWPITGATGGPLRAPLGDCRGCTALVTASPAPIAAIYASAAFVVGDELGRLSHLQLRLLATDGAIVWINGREVARRRIARDAAPLARAEARSTGEWESFVVPRSVVRRGPNLVAVEVRPARADRVPILDLELRGGQGAGVVRGPIVQAVSRTGATVLFDTDVPARGGLEVEIDGVTRSLPSAGGALAVHHVVEIGGLPADQAVRYRTVVNGEVGPEATFHAGPAPGRAIRLAIYGDTRNGHPVHA